MSVINFINKKSRSFTVLFFSSVSLLLLPFVTLVATATQNEYSGLIVGVTLMIIAIPFHCLAKKRQVLYLISYLLNTVANGFSLSALYVSRKATLHSDDLLLAVIPSIVILFLTFLLLKKSKKSALIFTITLNCLLIISMIAIWIIRGGEFYSFGFFCLLISLFYLCVFSVTVNREERLVMRDISFGSFGSFIILTVVVLFIISEGEVLDGIDAPDIDLKKRKNNAK